jgi:hypothetical protein
MKIIVSFFILSFIFSFQETSYDFDSLRGCSYQIIKASPNRQFTPKINACDINSMKTAETLFGMYDKSTSFKDMLFNENFTVLTYRDGLLLWISNDSKHLFTFTITSDKYSMILENGKEIKLGLTLDDFKVIFPKSYAQRSLSSKWGYKEGKTKIAVFFSFLNNENKEVIGGSRIDFVFNNETNRLEEIFSWVPG